MDCLKIEHCQNMSFTQNEQLQMGNSTLLSSLDSNIKEQNEQTHITQKKRMNCSARRHFRRYPKKYKIFSIEMKKLCVQEVRMVTLL